MNLETQLLKEHSKANCLIIVNWIGIDQKKFNSVIDLIDSPEVKFQQRASQVLHHAIETNKIEVSEAQALKLISFLKNKELHNSVYRNVLKVFDMGVSIPPSEESFMLDFFVKTIMNTNAKIAVRAFSVGAMYRMVLKYPDLKNEFKEVLLSISDNDSAGMRSRKKNYLAKVERL